MKRFFRRFTAMTLAVCMCISFVCAEVWAAEPETEQSDESTVVVSEEEVETEAPETEEASAAAAETETEAVFSDNEGSGSVGEAAQPEKGEDDTGNDISTDSVCGEPEKLEPQEELSTQATVASGSCGKNLTWTLNDKGVLTISGTGKMWDYEFEKSPWFENSRITAIVVDHGVTSVGENACRNLPNLTSVTLPDTVTSIGNYAFMWCPALSTATILDGVESIGDRTFYECEKLSNVTIPQSVTSIGESAFCRTTLCRVTIPDALTSLGDSAFYDCIKLTSVTIDDELYNDHLDAFRNTPWFTANVTSDQALRVYSRQLREDGNEFCVMYLSDDTIPDLVYKDPGGYTIMINGSHIISISGYDSVNISYIPHKNVYKVDIDGTCCEYHTVFLHEGNYGEREVVSNDNGKYTKDIIRDNSGRYYNDILGKWFWTEYITKAEYDSIVADLLDGERLTECVFLENTSDIRGRYILPEPQPEEKTLKNAFIKSVSNQTKTTSSGIISFNLKAKAVSGGKLSYKSSDKKVKISGSGQVTIPKNYLGKFTVTIKAVATSKYKSASKIITVDIVPPKVSVKSLTSPKKKWIKVAWKAVKGFFGYQLEVSESKDFKTGKQKRSNLSSKEKDVTMSGLKSKKSYYVRMRTYKKKGSKPYYGAWSAVKSVKVK